MVRFQYLDKTRRDALSRVAWAMWIARSMSAFACSCRPREISAIAR
jgi:hypothetical protein